MNDLDDFMSAFPKKRSPYTAEDIENALKKAKKTGTNFMEALQETTSKVSDMHAERNTSDSLKKKTETNKKKKSILEENTPAKPQEESTSNRSENYKEIEDLCEQASKELANLCASTSKEIAHLDQHLKEDFGISIEDTVASVSQKDLESSSSPLDAESFHGIVEKVEESVFGQADFLKKLFIAFKRPYILPPEEALARNSIYITGPEGSGRHLALQTMTREFYQRKLLASPEIQSLDLALYNVAGKDNVFLQDLYTALQSKAQVILLEHFSQCHISYLTYLSDLVIKGICRLQDRYILQKGQLVNVSNSFAQEAVSTFEARGKYLVFLSEDSLDSLADVMGAPFINALGDICSTVPLEEESFLKIAKVSLENLKNLAAKQFSFLIEVEEEAFLSIALASTEKNAGSHGLKQFFHQLEKSLATLKLEGDYDKDSNVHLIISESKLYAMIGEEKHELLTNLPTKYLGALDAVKKEMEQIVGLKEVKNYILSLEEYYNTQKRRKESGLKASELSKHMIFAGNPGTGKTTIARIISRYLKAIGILSGGQLVEVSRADLVGRYVGHTAPLVNNVIKSAIGGVLFIDEAYSLYRGKEDSFGLEAIDTLVKGMEDHRNDLIVILAGYSKEMKTFLEANSGLKSRFPNIIEFPDYTGEELLEITKITVHSKGYLLAEDADASLLNYYNEIQTLRADTAGNGRLVRNKVEEAILNQSRRLIAETDADLSLLTLADFNLTDPA